MKKGLLSIVAMFALILMAGCSHTGTNTKTNVNDNLKVDDTVVDDGNGEQDNTISDSDLGKLATCLSEAGLTMYGTEWCSHCKTQKALFGDNFDKVNYVDCDEQKPACVAAGVQGFPTWVDNKGDNYPGVQSLEKLATLAECEI